MVTAMPQMAERDPAEEAMALLHLGLCRNAEKGAQVWVYLKNAMNWHHQLSHNNLERHAT